MPGEKVYCVCEGRTNDRETKCRKRITQGKGSSAKNQAVRIRAIRDADYKYKEGDRLHVNCLKKLWKELEATQKFCVCQGRTTDICDQKVTDSSPLPPEWTRDYIKGECIEGDRLHEDCIERLQRRKRKREYDATGTKKKHQALEKRKNHLTLAKNGRGFN